MKVGKVFQQYIRSGQNVPPWVRRWKHKIFLLCTLFLIPWLLPEEAPPWVERWKRRSYLLYAFLTPGYPQILSKHKHRVLLGSILCLCGTGALITMIIGLLLSGVFLSERDMRTFDPVYAIAMPNFLSVLYPMEVAPSVESAENPGSIHPPNEPLLVQPFFWELLYACIILYVLCAIISFWDQWKSGNNVAGSKIAE
jgi:hypothetical protein